MTKITGRNKSTSDEADVGTGVTLNSTTSVVIAAANADRTFFHVDGNFSEKASWIKLQAASIDDDKKGIWLNEKEKGGTSWTMPVDNIYTGEISGIADSGSPILYVTEY
ncbi:MAG: hypothetical protein V3R25_09210 [Nitrosomonadaceae bacterium]